jgi:peptidoglycan/LPS O-acetylase OafA/YrhL
MPWLNAMGMNFYLAMAIDIFIVIILAYTITKLIEQPAMRYIRNKYIRRSAAIKKDPVSI